MCTFLIIGITATAATSRETVLDPPDEETEKSQEDEEDDYYDCDDDIAFHFCEPAMREKRIGSFVEEGF